MPLIRVSVDACEEIISEFEPENLPPGLTQSPPSGEFEYDAASGRFSPEELGPTSRVVLEVLLAAGATGFRVRYDGGNDEGFADPESLQFGEKSMPAAGVLRELTTAEGIARIREAAGQERFPGSPTQMYASASAAEVATYALEELAGELATRLLGRGFGTGEYELYGAFTADLKTGELVDDPAAAKPEHLE